MRNHNYDPDITPGDLIARHRFKPMPTRHELIQRDSFGNSTRLANNKYLNQMLKVKCK